jgi:hypothetical protein
MNNQPDYWGRLGKTHRLIYEDSLKGKVDPAARKVSQNTHANPGPDRLERILERIFHSDERIIEQAREYKPPQNSNANYQN